MNQQNNDFGEKLDNLLKHSNNFNAFERNFKSLWSVIKEYPNYGFYAHGLEAIWNIISSNNTKDISRKNILDVEKTKKLIDLFLILAYVKNPPENIDIENCLKNYNSEKRKFIKENYGGIDPKRENDYSNIENYLFNKEDFKSIFNSSNTREFDFSNLPQIRSIEKLVMRGSILSEIKNTYIDHRIIVLNADVGFGKSTLAYQYKVDYICSYDSGFAYSFTHQGETDEANITGDDFFRALFRHYSGKDSENIEEDKNKLFKTLAEKNSLLFIDGLEVIQDQNGNIKYKAIRDFLLEVINHEKFNSKILITSRIKLNFGKDDIQNTGIEKCINIEIKALNGRGVINIFKNNGYDTRDPKIKSIIRAICQNTFLQNPLVVSLIIGYIKVNGNGGHNSYNIDTIITEITNSEDHNNGDIEKIKSFIDKLLDKATLLKEEENFMIVASFLHRPISDHEYELIQRKLSSSYPELSDELISSLEEQRIVVFDKRDAGKTGVNAGTFDIHPLVKEVYRNKATGRAKKSIYKAFSATFLEIYECSLRHKEEKDMKNDEIEFIFDSLYYDTLLKQYEKVHSHIHKYINGKLPIRRDFKEDALKILNMIYNEESNEFYSESNIDNIFYSYKLYLFLMMTLGKPKKAAEISIVKLNDLDNMLMKASITKDAGKYKFVKNVPESLGQKESELLEKLDWLIGAMEYIKYAGDTSKAKEIFKYYDNIINKENTNNSDTLGFVDFLYQRRLYEYRYMMNVSTEKPSIAGLNALLEEENKMLSFDSRNIDENTCNEATDSFAEHSHILWRERYVHFILDDIIWDLVEKKCKNIVLLPETNIMDTIEKLTKMLESWKRIYENPNPKRIAYLYGVHMGLAKINFIYLMTTSRALEKSFDTHISTAKQYVNKSQKKDFRVDYFLNYVLMNKMLGRGYAEEYSFLHKLINDIEIKFLIFEYRLLEKLIGNGISNNTYETMKKEEVTIYPYLSKRLEVIKNCSDFQSQSSQK